MSTVQTLSLRQLGRATLARQMLLGREEAGVAAAVERLAGLQAQLARPPFIGLWSRLAGFRREDLAGPLVRRELVRATMMRGTLHVVSARDYLELRPVLQPLLTKAVTSVLRERARDLDIEGLLSASRGYLAGEPRTFEEIRDHLTSLGLPGDERARGFAVRCHLPLVQVPDGGDWAYPSAARFTLADGWLGRPVAAESGDARGLVRRYLAAFGPASVVDAQTWSGMAGMRGVFEELRPELVTFRDERGRELFDLPGAPRPAEDVPAPARFLPDFDNLVLAHDDRSRLIADEHRPLVSKPNLAVLPTFLVDGRVAGTWSIQTTRGTAVLAMEPFVPIPKAARDELLEEGERLVRFVEPGAKGHDVRLAGAAEKGTAVAKGAGKGGATSKKAGATSKKV